MDGEALLKLVEATAKATALETMQNAIEHAPKHVSIDDIKSAFAETHQVPEAVVEPRTVAESATNRKGWGDLQDVIRGDLVIDLEAGKYARSK